MIRYASQVGVTRSPADVFAAVNDISGWTGWTDMREVRPEAVGPIRVGSAGTFTLAKGPFKGPIRYEATTVEPDRRVVYHLTHSAFEWVAQMAVEPDGAGSRLSSSGTFRLRGMWRLLQPVVGGEIARGEAAELDRLKAILEAHRTEGATESTAAVRGDA
jgi:hypothetical protein